MQIPRLVQILRLILAVFSICILPSASFAWGPEAHRIVASIAWLQLSDDAKRNVEDLLGRNKSATDPLTAVATWADEHAVRNPKTRAWHFVDIPLNYESYSRSRDCRDDNCIVEKIGHFKKQLQYGKTRQERIDALKYLVHLVGDLHEPLHCADNNDAGGTRVQVTFFGKVSNLHRVWDSDMIDRTGLTEASYTNKLMAALPSQGYWIEDWANESHLLARNYAYDLPVDRALANAYYQANLPILDRQLARAGVRLAQVLEDSLMSSK
jgi:hypothetical protein